MKKYIKVMAVLLAASGALAYFIHSYNKENGGPREIRTTGVVEAIETNVSAKVAGKLSYIAVREGARVKKGELLARLESADLAAALGQARSALRVEELDRASGRDAVESARAGVEVAKAGVESAKAALVRAEAQLAQADIDLRRADELFGKGVVSKSDLDNARTNEKMAAAGQDSAKAGLALAGSQLAAAKAALMKARGDLEAQAARVSQARHGVELQEAQLSYSEVYSPVDGVVEYRSLEEGEVVGPGQGILTLVDLSGLWVRMDLEQGDVTRVKLGQAARISIERAPGKVFDGEVFDIGREGEFAVERDVTRGRQDIKTFRTRIRVKDPEGVLKPGMTVMVEIPEK